MNRKITLITLLAILCSCGDDSPKTVNQSNTINKQFYHSATTVKVSLSEAKTELSLTGKVLTDPDKTISYTPLVSGVIDRIYFALGDKVQKGQVLLDIRSTELSTLQADLISLESELGVAQRELKGAQAMFDDNMLSERELMEAKSKVLQTEAALQKNKTDISVFGVSKGAGTFSIKAPASGYIISKNASPGSTITSENECLFKIADINTVWIVANVYASNLQYVKEGMEADILSVSYPNEVFHGKIDVLSQVFDPEDKALKARIVFNNKDMKLKPEMSVTIRLKSHSHEKLFGVPNDAIIFDNDTYFVVIRKTDNFEIRKIAPFSRNSYTTYTTSGLNEGEDVVTKNQLLIYSELKGK